MSNYDLLFSDDYAYESYDSLFDDSYSYGYAMEATDAKESFGQKLKNLFIRFKNFVASFLKNAISILTGTKDKNGVVVHRSVITFISDMLKAAKADAEKHYKETHQSSFIGESDYDFDFELALESVNAKYEIVIEKAKLLLNAFNAVALESTTESGDYRTIGTTISNFIQDVNESKNRMIEEAKKNGDTECAKTMLRNYDRCIIQLDSYINEVKTKFKDDARLHKYLDEKRKSVDDRSDKREYRSNISQYNEDEKVRKSTSPGIYKVENPKELADGKIIAKYVNNAGNILIREADSKTKEAFNEAKNTNSSDSTSSSNSSASPQASSSQTSGSGSSSQTSSGSPSSQSVANKGTAASGEGFFAGLLRRVTLFFGTLTRFFKYTWNGILTSIKIRRAERMLENAKVGLYGNKSSEKEYKSRETIEKERENRITSSFIGRIAAESYNEGYQAAMESVLSKNSASRMIGSLKRMAADSYDLDPKDKKAVKAFINKWEDKADEIDKIISENAYAKDFAKDSVIFLIAFFGSAIMLPIPVIGPLLGIITQIGSVIAFIVISYKKTNRLTEIAAQLDKLSKSVNRLANNNALDAEDRKRLQKLADKLH